MKIPFFIALVSVASILSASPGDTTKVRTHNKVLIQTDPSKGHTEYPAWGVFPKKGTQFHKMYAELTFKCPPGLTCGEWDYLNYIFIGKRHGSKKDTLDWEIIRFITPYGLQFNQQWSHTWRFDITDFATLFHDSVEIWYQHTGYEAKNGRGWLIDVEFTMIEGTPAKEVKDIHMLYRKSVGYGDDLNFANGTPEVAYKTQPSTTEVRYKILQSGHGADAPENCGEFCAKNRYLMHDGKPIDTVLVWRDNCGENPVYPQGGTWIYDRANWCPGAEVEEYNKNISIQGGSEHKFDLNMQSYTSTNGGGNYMITAYVIEYGPSAFQLDASIEDILRPTSDPRYLRLNPNCGEPRIAIKNNGIENITSAYIEYGWEGMKPNRYMWNGLIQQGMTVQIDLPFIGNDAPVGTRFVCRFVWVNNRVDDYALNNKIASIPLTRTPVHQEELYILLRTNNAASENYYTLTSADGKTILNKSNLKNNTIYRDTVKLEPGCYMLNLMDDGTPPSSYPLNEDGLGWWANTADGTGLFQIRSATSNSIIKSFPNDFGTGIWYQFTVGNIPQAEAPKQSLTFYPNPAHHDILIDLGKNTEGSLHILLYNTQGQKILEETRNGALDALQYLDVSAITNGVYILKLGIGDLKITSKIIIH